MWPLHPSLVNLPRDSEKRKRGYPPLPLIEGDEIVDPEVTAEEQARFTTEFTNRAVRFIERHRDEPFLLYVAHPMPHVPLFVSDKFAGKSVRGRYGDVIMEIDWSVGQIVAALERENLRDNTLVIFTSDNGPWLSYGNHAGSTGPLREGKGTTWEGGVREPCIVSWPGRVPAGETCDEPAMTIDIFPTVARLIGAELPGHTIDGKDIWPLLAGEPGAKSPHDVLYFYYGVNNLEALRSGKWKLVLPHQYRSLTDTPGADGMPAGYTFPKCGLELYDLAADIGETNNVLDQHPDVVARLQEFAEQARADLGDGLTKREGANRRPAGSRD